MTNRVYWGIELLKRNTMRVILKVCFFSYPRVLMLGLSVFLVHCTQQPNLLIHQRYQHTQQEQKKAFNQPLRVFKFNDINGQSYLLKDWHNNVILLHSDRTELNRYIYF